MTDLLLQTFFNAAYAASHMALVAVGLVLIFGVMGVINFAHGEIFMLGAYATAAVYAKGGAPFFVAVLTGAVLTGLIGAGMERGMFRPLRGNPLGGLVASIGFLLILQALVSIVFGVRPEHVPPPTKAVIQVGGAALPVQRLAVIAAALVLLGGLRWFLRNTRTGWALRACAQDPEAAALQGVSIVRSSRLAMVVGAALAGTAGALVAPLIPPSPLMGHPVIVAAFIVVIVGGVGSLEGAAVAAVLYAFVHTCVTTFFDGVVADIVGLALMLAVLVARPQGLFGVRERA